MLSLIRIELYKIFRRGRTYISFGAIAFIVLAIQLGFSIEGQNILNYAVEHLKDDFMFQGNLMNAYLVSHLILNTLLVQIPFLVALVTGDLLAGEANAGTFRMLLVRPISRTQLVVAKFIAALVYTLMLMLFLVFMSLGVGRLVLGIGDLLVINNSINIFSQDDVLWRFAGAYTQGTLTMLVVAALSFFLSALADNGIGPIIGTVAIIIGITVISNIGLTFLNPIKPYLFTTHLNTWMEFFDYAPDTGRITRSFSVLIAYLVAFFGISLYIFRRKDILS